MIYKEKGFWATSFKNSFIKKRDFGQQALKTA